MVGDHRIECGDPLIHVAQPFQLQTEHLTVYRVRSACHRFDQLFFTALQPVIA
jgi:hypothetical protein